MLSAADRAKQRWAPHAVAARTAKPWPCQFCVRNLGSKGAATLHMKRCSKNLDAEMYTSGDYSPLMRDGRIVGYISNGRNDFERRTIRAGYEKAWAALGGFLG